MIRYENIFYSFWYIKEIFWEYRAIPTINLIILLSIYVYNHSVMLDYVMARKMHQTMIRKHDSRYIFMSDSYIKSHASRASNFFQPFITSLSKNLFPFCVMENFVDQTNSIKVIWCSSGGSFSNYEVCVKEAKRIFVQASSDNSSLATSLLWIYFCVNIRIMSTL